MWGRTFQAKGQGHDTGKGTKQGRPQLLSHPWEAQLPPSWTRPVIKGSLEWILSPKMSQLPRAADCGILGNGPLQTQ